MASTPKTMAELLAQSKTKLKSFLVGDKVTGKVVEITPKNLLVDIGGKSEGMVAEKAFIEARDFIRKLSVGDEITAEVIVPETNEGYTILSLRSTAKDFLWNKIDAAYEKEEELTVEVLNVNQSGLIVDVFGVSGFIPKSQIGRDLSKATSNLVGKKIQAVIIDEDRYSNRVVLSEKAVSEKEEIAAQKKAMAKIKDGEVYEGKVTTVTDFGIFVEIQATKTTNLEGLVHISELSWEKVGKPSDIYKEGDKVKVKVLEVKNGKLSLTIKGAKKDPWDEITSKYKPEDELEGKIVRISDFGVFVQLEPGVEGLVHITKIPPTKTFSRGDMVNVSIEEIDPSEKKISLGLVLTEKPLGYK